RVAELDRRDVDRDLEVRRPAARVLHRLLHDAHRQGADQAGGFGDLDEMLGLEETALGRTPAGERLETDELAALEVDQRLEERHELALEDSSAHVLFEAEALGQLAVELLVEPGELIPPRALGRVKRD